MAGSTETFISLQEGLSGNLQKATKEWNSFNDVSSQINKNLSTQNKSMNETSDVSTKINDTYDDISETSEKVNGFTDKWKSGLSGVLGIASKIGGAFAGVFALGSVVDAIEDTFTLHQEMTRLAVQMGHGRAATQEFETALIKTQEATGRTAEEVTSMIRSLGQARVAIGDMQQLATDTLNFAKATGVSDDAAANLSSKLSLMGGLGQKSISGIMSNMMDVQRQFGMSTESVNALTTGIVDTTKTLRTLGKSSAEVEKFQKGAIKLAGAFESVGIEASQASEILDRLLDPGKLEDNALLYSKLGISIEDAMSGNIDPQQVMSGLQGIGSELKNMSGPAAAALAQSMGMSLTQLRQMSEMDMSQLSQELGFAADASGNLASGVDETVTAQEEMKENMNKVKGIFQEVLVKLMPLFDAVSKAIGGLLDGFVESGGVEKMVGMITGAVGKIKEFMSPAIETFKKIFSSMNPKMLLVAVAAIAIGIMALKKKFASVSTDSSKKMKTEFESSSKDISKALEDGVSGGLAMAAEKSASIIEEKFRMASEKIEADIKDRTIRGAEHGAMQGAAKYQEILAGQDTFGFAKGANAAAAKLLETLSESTKPVSKLDDIYAGMQGKLVDKYNLSKTAYQEEIGFLNDKQELDKQELSKMQDRFDYLDALGSKRSTEEAAEREALIDRIKLKDEEFSKDEKRIEDITKLQEDAAKKNIKRIDKQILAGMADSVHEQLLQEKALIKEKQKGLDQLNTEMSLQEDVTKATNKQYGALVAKQKALGKGEKLTAEESLQLTQLAEQRKRNATLERELTEQISASTNEIEQMDAAAKALEKEFLTLEDASGGIRLNKNEQEFKTLEKKLGDIRKVFTGNLMSGIGDFWGKTKKSFGNAKKAFQDAFNGKTFRTSVRMLERGALKAGAGLAKNVLKASAGLAKKAAGAGIKLAKKIGSASKDLAKKGLEAAKAMASKLKGAAGGIARGAAKGMAMAGGALLMGTLAKSEAGQKMMEKLQGVMTSLMESLGPAIDSLMPVVDELVKNLGPVIAQVAGFVVGLVQKMLPFITKLMDRVMPLISKLLGALMPVIESAMDALMPLIDALLPLMMDLIGALLPALMPIFKLLLDMMMPLVKALLPPMLKVLGFLLKIIGTVIAVIGKLIQALSHIPGLGGLSEVGKTIEGIGEGFKEAGDAMIDSADRMTGASIELKDAMKDLSGNFENLQFESLSNNVQDMTSMLGITTEEAGQMSHRELTQAIEEAGVRGEMVQQLRANTEELQRQYTRMQAENLAQSISQEIEEAQQGMVANIIQRRNINDINWSGTGDREAFGDAAFRMSEERLNDLYRRLERSNGQFTTGMLEDFGDIFTAAGGDFAKAIQGEEIDYEKLSAMNSNGWGSEFFQDLSSMVAGAELGTSEMEAAMTQVRSFFSGEGNEAEQTAIDELIASGAMTDIWRDANGNIEKVVSQLTNQLAKEGSSLDNANWDRVFQERLAELQDGLVNARKELYDSGEYNSTTIQGTPLQNAIEKAYGELADMSGKEGLEQLYKIIGESDEALAAMMGGQFSTLEELNARMEANREANETTAGNTEPEDEGDVVTKLYPAIVEASSSGFVESQEAVARTSGGSPEEQQVEVSERIYEGIMQLVGLSEDGNSLTAQQAREIADRKAAELAQNNINNAGGTEPVAR